MFASRFLGLFAVVTLSASALAGPSSGPEIYAINHQGNYPNFGDTLIRFNADDPEGFVTVGFTGIGNVGLGGLAFDGDGNLWAYGTFNSFGGAASGLYRMNTNTGQATPQGTLSTQTLNDLAWNPVDEKMYGVYSQGFATSRLYTVNLQSGAVTFVGTFSGLDTQHNLIGLGISSAGTVYVYDNMNNKFYVANSALSVTLLYDSSVTQCTGCELAVGSQGIDIDWSRNNLGYHGSAGQGVFPDYYGTLNTFTLDGTSYVWGPSFGPSHTKLPPPYPPRVQAGDVAIVPASLKVIGDLNGDGVVGAADLGILLGSWGTPGCGGASPCFADLNGDGNVGPADLGILLGNWG